MEFWNQFLNSTICIPSTISLVPNVQIITPFITTVDTDTNSSLNSDCVQLQQDENDGYNQDNNGNYVIEQKDDNEEENEDDEEEVDEDNEEEKDVKKQSIQRIRYLKEEYRCEQCSYTCTIEKAFLRHIRWCESGDVQSTNHPLSCPICGKDRKNQELLSIHMNKHRQDKHFCCDVCKFKTLQLKKLIQHRRMHTGEKPHLCPFCSYRSARRDNLRSHARRVHKKNDLPCDTFIPRSMVLSPRKNYQS